MTTKRSPGMQLRRPGVRATPAEADVRMLEERAERVATKEPGRAVSAKPYEPAVKSEPVLKSEALRGRKAQITAYLPVPLRDRLRLIAVALSGPPCFETVTSIVERAIERELERLEAERGPFEETTARPRPGRRAGRP